LFPAAERLISIPALISIIYCHRFPVSIELGWQAYPCCNANRTSGSA
jgi:hypothetical protein